jgi:hypothetical protein
MNTVSYSEAVAEHGQLRIDAIMAHHRHHHDDQGGVYWLEDELAEAIELVEFEAVREQKELESRLAQHESELEKEES